jgi:dihydrofolate reductase/thymidylate synthase
MRTFECIVACDANRGIGLEGSVPWRLRGDMAYFKRKTSAVEKEGNVNAVIMGRKTWESIPAKFRPLPGRLNIILTRNEAYRE